MRARLRRSLLAAGIGVALSVGPVAPAVALAAPASPGTRIAASEATAVTASAPTVVTASATDVDDFSFDSLDVQYTLGRDDDGAATLEVQERFVAVFPETDQNHGMRRIIPDSYLGAPLDPQLVSITDGDGDTRPAETDSEDGFFVMTSRADDFVHGAQTYMFTYTLRNVTRFFADTGADEFYWDVNGTGWPQPFGRVTARLILPPDLAEAATGERACYVGAEGSTQTCAITTDAGPGAGATITASAAPVPAFQTVTVAVGFAQGTFTAFDPSFTASPWGWLQAAAGLGVLASLAFAIIVRARRLRDDPGRPTIIAEYTPPPGIDALESAVLLGRSTKAIPAEVLEQAVVGSIRIVEGAPRLFGGTRLTAQLVDPSRADGDGRLLLDGLFPDLSPGAEYEFGRTDTRFSKAAQSILKLANQELLTRGLRRRVPAGVRAWPVLAAVVTSALVVLFGVAALGASVTPVIPLLLMVAAVVAAIVAIGLVSRRPLTAAGAETRDHLRGLEEFIAWAEADRIRMLQSPSGAERVRIDPADPAQMLRLYETLLPYAVVFGQEKQWAQQLAVLYGPDRSPVWYAGAHGFTAASFSSGIGSLSASSAAASSSGGSGGGGSAGGGGGGGGGGGV